MRGGKPGSGLDSRSAQLIVGRLSAAFEQAIDDRKVYRNPCRKVRVDGRQQSFTDSLTGRNPCRLRAMLETCGSAGEGCTFPVIA